MDVVGAADNDDDDVLPLTEVPGSKSSTKADNPGYPDMEDSLLTATSGTRTEEALVGVIDCGGDAL